MDEAAQSSQTSPVEDSQICTLTTEDLLSDAQKLLKDIQELLELCPPGRRQCTMKIPSEYEYCIKEDGDAMVIGDFRFESAASQEDLMMLGTTTTQD